MDKFEGKEKLHYEDYLLLADGYKLVCDNMNFISDVSEIMIKKNGLVKLNNTKVIKRDYKA